MLTNFTENKEAPRLVLEPDSARSILLTCSLQNLSTYRFYYNF